MDDMRAILVAALIALVVGYGLGWREGGRHAREQVERRVRAVLNRWAVRNPLDAQQLRRQLGIEDGAADEKRGLDPLRDWLDRIPFRDYFETPRPETP